MDFRIYLFHENEFRMPIDAYWTLSNEAYIMKGLTPTFLFDFIEIIFEKKKIFN